MKRRNPIKILHQILKTAHVEKIFLGYVIFFCTIAGLVMAVDPAINHYGDALWYCFVSCTTIGFGDLVAGEAVSRLLTVILYLYTLVVVALFTAVTTQFIFESIKDRNNESAAVLLDDMEHLEDLPKERLAEISAKVREKRNTK